MNIDKYHIQHNNFCSNIDNNCTNASDRHNPDKYPLTVCHTASTWFVVQTCASLCVVLCVLSFRLDILLFFWTLPYCVWLLLIIRTLPEKVTICTNYFSP